MELEDRLTLRTPEGVELEVVLAGLGSRMLAGALDLVLKGLLIGLLAIVLVVPFGEVGLALFLVALFASLFLYDVVFEVAGAGRTPGKRAAGLRVLRESGAPVDLVASVVRNLLRLVDGLPLSYVPTMIGVLVTRRNQRPGDVVAGTIVVRERIAAAEAAAEPRPAAPGVTVPVWDASGVGAAEVGAARDFLARRSSLPPAPRARIAARLAGQLRPRVGGADEPDDERFLEAVVAAKEGRS